MNTVAYILILFAHVGPMGDGNSNALSTIEMTSQETCVAAGEAAKALAAGSTKVIKYACAKK